jgi:hypothetical protein
MALFGRTTNKQSIPPGEASNLYLQLMIRCPTNYIYDDDADMLAGRYVEDAESGKYLLEESAAVDPEKKFMGGVWPSRAHTMIGVPRLENIMHCVEDVLIREVPGDLIETGVWRGGGSIFMRAILKIHGIVDRKVWVADSFEGLPPPNEKKYPHDKKVDLYKFEVLAVPIEEVVSNFNRYGLLDDQVIFVKGWFRDTLPDVEIDQLAVMRLDGDLYESTMDALVNLYPKLSVGGYVIVDDYGAVKACNEAIHDFRRQRGITDEMQEIPGCGIFWQRSLRGG